MGLLADVTLFLLIDAYFTALILQGDFYTGSVLAASLAKLVLRFSEESADSQAANALRAEVRLDYRTAIVFFALNHYLSGNAHHGVSHPHRPV